jgi:hypothetical protein
MPIYLRAGFFFFFFFSASRRCNSRSTHRSKRMQPQLLTRPVFMFCMRATPFGSRSHNESSNAARNCCQRA